MQESAETTDVVTKECQTEPSQEAGAAGPVAPDGESVHPSLAGFEAYAFPVFEVALVAATSSAEQSKVIDLAHGVNSQRDVYESVASVGSVDALTGRAATEGPSTDEKHDEAEPEGDALAVSVEEQVTPILVRHPIAEDFGRFRKGVDYETDLISADIRHNGQRVPIVRYQGMVLDGWHRYCVCLKFGLQMKFIEYTGDNPLGEFMSLNRHREHLTQAQLAAIIARHVDLTSLAAHGGLRDQAATLPLATIASLASQAGVSPRTQARAVKVAKANPATLDRVISRELSLVKAEVLEYPKVVESEPPVDVQTDADDDPPTFAERMATTRNQLLESWNMPPEIEAVWLEHLAWADREIANLKLINGLLRAELRDFRALEESPPPERIRPYTASVTREFDPVRLGAASTGSEG